MDEEHLDEEHLAADAEAILEQQTTPAARRRIVWRLIGLTLAAFSLYLFFPSLVQVFASVDDLNRISPIWFALMLALQAGSFTCVWLLQRIALRTERWFPVATSQLAGNAFSRVVPGGAAAGVALQYRMLASAGISTTSAASSLTAVSLLTTGTVLALPVLSLPAMLGGTPVDRGLLRAALLGSAVFVVMVGVGALLLFATRPLLALGHGVQRIVNRVRRHREPVDDLAARLVEERDLIRNTLQQQWWQALLAAVGRSMLDYGALLVALLAVGADPNPSLVLLAYVSSQVLGMIPITPGGLGFVEAGLAATLTLSGVPVGLAAVSTLAYRLAAYWLPLIAGLVAGAMFRRRYPNGSGDVVPGQLP